MEDIEREDFEVCLPLSAFCPLTETLEGLFDKPIEELPEDWNGKNLRESIRRHFWPPHWESLSASQRKRFAETFDAQHDPARWVRQCGIEEMRFLVKEVFLSQNPEADPDFHKSLFTIKGEFYRCHYWTFQEIALNGGNKVDWGHWLNLGSLTQHEAACLVYGADPDYLEERGTPAYDDDFKKLRQTKYCLQVKAAIEKLSRELARDKSIPTELTAFAWADLLRKRGHDLPPAMAELEAPQAEPDLAAPVAERAEPGTGAKPRTRTDRLMVAIQTALLKRPALTTDELFNLLPDHDETGVVVDGTDDKLTWVDTRGKYHDIDRAIFANRVSRLRGRQK